MRVHYHISVRSPLNSFSVPHHLQQHTPQPSGLVISLFTALVNHYTLILIDDSCLDVDLSIVHQSIPI